MLIYAYGEVWSLSAYKTKHEHVNWNRSATSALPGLSEETERQNGMNIMYILLVFHVWFPGIICLLDSLKGSCGILIFL